MALIDFILNLAGLFLWLNWRAVSVDPLSKASAATLVGTLRHAETKRWRGWYFLASLTGVLLVRALVYAQIGPTADWTPKLDLGLVVLPFRSDRLQVMLLYSMLSFGRALAIFYFWLLTLAVINRGMPDADPLLRWIRSHLGHVARWPVYVQALLPLAGTAAVWLALSPVLTAAGTMARASSWLAVLEQGLLLGAAVYFSLKLLLPVVLLSYLMISYVYLGSSPFWQCVTVTAQKLLAPFRALPLRVGRVDFSPVAATVLLLVFLEVLPTVLMKQYPELRRIIWPQ